MWNELLEQMLKLLYRTNRDVLEEDYGFSRKVAKKSLKIIFFQEKCSKKLQEAEEYFNLDLTNQKFCQYQEADSLYKEYPQKICAV